MRRLSLAIVAALAASLFPLLGANTPLAAAPRPGAPSLRGDFNGDGFADIAIGVPGESVSSHTGAGAVNVIYGSAAGLTSSGNQQWTQDSSGIQGTAGTDDHFGQSVAVGDFNNDGFDDLAIGVPDDDPAQITDAGVVNVIYGSGGGLSSSGNQKWSQGSSGIQGTEGSLDGFGRSLAAGDFNGNGFADLAIGVPHDDPNQVQDAGVVNVIYGGSGGLSSSGNQKWSQESSGIQGTAGESDVFGHAVAAGDFDGDGFADLAVGAPGDNPDHVTDAGVVNVIYGASGGLSSSGNQRWSQNSSGIGDSAETNDNFGLALAAGDFGNSSQADLAVGVPKEGLSGTSAAGGVHVIYGTSSGLSSSSSQFWTQSSSGILGDPGTDDQFGWAVAAGDLGNGSQADLAVGVPGEVVSTKDKAGAVNVLYGGSGGLSSTGNQQWTQDSPNVQGTADPDDNFGFAVAIQDFGNSAEADLAAGVPNEDVSGVADAGDVNVLYGGSSGISSNNNQTWTQDSTGIVGTAGLTEQFGDAVA